ncbi:DMT(drug/metabolite transporter) superfamily permease [Burkholderiales bacterium JOSHI_001]|nr:DMT(drug/metabolite transporter) superfamily permease [Burkholderiales bacterium JOSHI_001]
MHPAERIPDPRHAHASRGWWLGLAGVLMFALTIPMTRLASGSVANPQLSAAFVAIGRAALAGLLALAYLRGVQAPWPTPAQWRALAVTASGVVFGFPLCMGLAVRQVEAVHAAVVTGLLPLATAVGAALWLRQQPPRAFWATAATGAALVLAYAAWQGGAQLQPADALLLAAVVLGALGYVSGARLSAQMPPEHVISWALVLALPFCLPWTLLNLPTQPVRAVSWVAFGYVAVVSMWLGFFAWYRGLALGGTLRVSQVQLVQPFLSMAFALPLLGEQLDAPTLGFALAVMACVLVSRRLAAPALPAPAKPAVAAS